MKKKIAIFSMGLLILMVVVWLAPRSSPDARTLSQAEFVAMVQSDLLAKVQVHYPAKLGQVDGVPVMLTEVRGTFYQTDAAGQISTPHGMLTESAFIARVNLTPELEGKLLARTNVSIIELNPLVQKASQWFAHSK